VVSAAAGAAWRVRALQRAQQLAKEQGRELNEVGLLQASHRTADAGCPCPESMLCSRCIM
jgi:conjugal transfer/entry exclusion protein